MRLSIVIVFIFLAYFGLNAQKTFEGRIVFKVEYLSLPEGMEGVEHMLPQKSTWMVRGQQTRVVQHVPLAGWQVIVYSPQLDSFYQQIELFDQKMMFAKPISFLENRFRIIPKSESKEILGLNVKQVFLQNAQGDVLEAWVSNKYSNTKGTELPELEGLPLQFELIRNNIKYRLTAVSMNEEPVDDTYFLVPTDVVRINTSDLQSILD